MKVDDKIVIADFSISCYALKYLILNPTSGHLRTNTNSILLFYHIIFYILEVSSQTEIHDDYGCQRHKINQ